MSLSASLKLDADYDSMRSTVGVAAFLSQFEEDVANGFKITRSRVHALNATKGSIFVETVIDAAAASSSSGSTEKTLEQIAAVLQSPSLTAQALSTGNWTKSLDATAPIIVTTIMKCWDGSIASSCPVYTAPAAHADGAHGFKFSTGVIIGIAVAGGVFFLLFVYVTCRACGRKTPSESLSLRTGSTDYSVSHLNAGEPKKDSIVLYTQHQFTHPNIIEMNRRNAPTAPVHIMVPGNNSGGASTLAFDDDVNIST
jgi:hypothetical protein